MLTLKIDDDYRWDEDKEEFVLIPGMELHLEHSLRSISKWEARRNKPFLSDKPKTAGEMLDYVYCMCTDEGVNPAVFATLSAKQFETIQEYINSPMTATWFSNREQAHRRGRVVTSELVYCWMSSFGIDWEAQDWHFNRLMTLIRVCSEENKPPKKMPKAKAAAQQRALNAKRLKQHSARG